MVETDECVGASTRWAFTGYLWVLGSFLALLVWQLHVEWTINPQYHFAWAVPPLALYLAWKRWPGRPPPRPAPVRTAVGTGAALLLAALLPIRLVHEANPDWRLTSWLLAMVLVALAVFAVWFAGGRPWLKHFLLPVGFLLVAVPWPVQLEQAVVQSLMRWIVRITTEFMNLAGYAAAQRGNFIELAQGSVIVNEGCSGIRSIQTTLMVALVLGELYLLSAGRRFGLVIGGFAWAVLVNLLRACLLTWICAHQGTEAVAAWHDPVGYLMLGLSIAGLWAFAAWRLGKHPSTSLLQDDQQQTAVQPAGFKPRRLAPKLAWAIMGWLLLTEAVTEGWYRSHEGAAQARSSWSIRFPPPETGFTQETLSPETLAILRCDESSTGTWKRPDGTEWKLFFLKWRPGRMAAYLARGHTPDVCLPANGFQMLGTLGLTTVRAGEFELPFTTYAFASRGGQLYFVFFCLTDPDGALMPEQALTAGQGYLDGLTRERRLQAVWNRARHRGQQVLEIAMTGYATPEQAQAALRDTLPNLIRFKSKES